MILKTIETKDKYPNGNFKYIETRAIISPMWIALYPNHRISDDGTLWIRIGVNKKFRPDGELQWELKYSDTGNIVK